MLLKIRQCARSRLDRHTRGRTHTLHFVCVPHTNTRETAQYLPHARAAGHATPAHCCYCGAAYRSAYRGRARTRLRDRGRRDSCRRASGRVADVNCAARCAGRRRRRCYSRLPLLGDEEFMLHALPSVGFLTGVYSHTHNTQRKLKDQAKLQTSSYSEQPTVVPVSRRRALGCCRLLIIITCCCTRLAGSPRARVRDRDVSLQDGP